MPTLGSFDRRTFHFHYRDAVVSRDAILITSPDDLHADASTRVMFRAVSEALRSAGIERAAAYDDASHVAMLFVDAATGEPRPRPEAIRLEVYDRGADEWVEEASWGGEEAPFNVLLLGRSYRAVHRVLGVTVFQLAPPTPARELFLFAGRHTTSYSPALHRMLLGDE